MYLFADQLLNDWHQWRSGDLFEVNDIYSLTQYECEQIRQIPMDRIIIYRHDKEGQLIECTHEHIEVLKQVYLGTWSKKRRIE